MKGIKIFCLYFLILSFINAENLLKNPGFEKVGSDKLPLNWETISWKKGPLFGVSDKPFSGKFSAFIYCPEKNDAAFIQKVKLQPHSVYRLSAWVKTENVRTMDRNWKIGANIGMYGTFVKSEDVKGTSDWRKISTIVFTTDNPNITICARLGFWFSRCKGKVWFDDLKLTQIPMVRIKSKEGDWKRKIREFADKDGFVSLEGKNVILRIKAKKILWLSDPFKWLEKLDLAYQAYSELVGGVPFNGKPVIIQEVEDYPGGLAIAGYPILWFGRYIDRPTFSRIEKGDWQFGILHEMGHVFDLDGRWVWHGEFFANFKMVYVADRWKAKIWHWGKWYDHSKGKRLDDFYKEMAKKEGELEKINSKDWPDHYTDPDTYHFCALKNIIGWEPFKKTFRSFLKLPPSKIPKDPTGKYKIFVKLLTKFSGFNCADWLEKRGFPKISKGGGK